MNRLTDIFKPEYIALGLQAGNKDAMVEELVSFLVRSHSTTRGEEILNAIRLRENKMSTGIKQGIALPHARIPAFGNAAGVLGICGPGVDFDSLDAYPVHLIFLFVSDSNTPDEHLDVLTQISRLSEMDGFYEEILSATTPENAAEIIAEFEAGIL